MIGFVILSQKLWDPQNCYIDAELDPVEKISVWWEGLRWHKFWNDWQILVFWITIFVKGS